MSVVWIGDRKIEGAEISRQSSQAATGFRNLGVAPGDCVALCLRNDIAFFEAGIGAAQIGAFRVAVNWHYTLDEFQYLMIDSGAKVLVIHADLLKPLRAGVPDGVTVIVVPVPDEIRIVDASGKEVPRGTAGVVSTRLWGVADFTYHGDDSKRRSAEVGGLITPGDIGYLDDEGFLFLCDRANDMIISGGVNIYPAEIEAQLQGMPGLADCAVFGIPNAEYGESICAVVQPQPGAALTEAGVMKFLTGKIAGYKMPRRVEFKFELPREDSGKIFKRKLREPFWENTGRSI